MRWCPGIGAGTKKLSKGGQKLRWCPGTGAGTKKLTKGGQKLRWCPEIGAGTKKLSKGGQKMRWCPGIGAGAENLYQLPLFPTDGQHCNFLFFHCHKAAVSEMKRMDRLQSFG
ncbi:MAG: hypothetical protein QM296_00030 [Bacillota bacterium]|nr:hypothetical protein [Bacillota bacterium]